MGELQEYIKNYEDKKIPNFNQKQLQSYYNIVLNKILKGVDFSTDDKKFKMEVFNSVITTYGKSAPFFIHSKE